MSIEEIQKHLAKISSQASVINHLAFAFRHTLVHRYDGSLSKAGTLAELIPAFRREISNGRLKINDVSCVGLLSSSQAMLTELNIAHASAGAFSPEIQALISDIINSDVGKDFENARKEIARILMRLKLERFDEINYIYKASDAS